MDDLEDMLLDYSSSDDMLEDPRDETDDDGEMLENSPLIDLMCWSTTDFPHLDDEGDPDLFMADEDDVEQNTSLAEGSTRDRTSVITRIEAMLENIVDALLHNIDPLSITLKTRSGITRRMRKSHASADETPAPKERRFCFPGSTVKEAWRFTVLLRIIELVHECLLSDVLITKRDIYYRDPNLFLKQTVVDRYVDDLACTLDVPRYFLNVTAAAKGLVAGNFSIHRAGGATIKGTDERAGILIPRVCDADSLELSSLRWILVIEKEATFSALMNSPQGVNLCNEGLILTGKGYPDVASRQFLCRIVSQSPSIPMVMLADYDPDGIAIMSTYKYSSYRLAHETYTAQGTQTLALPQLQWLGVQGHQISRVPVSECDKENTSSACGHAQGYMRLSSRDRDKARNMLAWDLCAENGLEPTWRREIQTMLMLNIKAEMQILEELPGGLVTWLGAELGAKTVMEESTGCSVLG
ncbi:meiosis-specific topoisomerase Spo11 [Dendryphion nanum]|uniref:DNA topoisomerase (ATP-hydrolyzing) n=1 Tax=Dendryphion nanum TaxID=256645 RepID=A0A9P9EDK1_9PLEO|nr:meiosis-specific topoisomerase Spo11 [Dendryphion nanum]